MDVMKVQDIRDYIADKFKKREFSDDKNGDLTIELLGASFIADEDCIFGKLNEEYIEKEIEWYNSQSTNIKDIYGEEREPPASWVSTADDNGDVNSNYGNLIYSKEFNNQFENVLEELTHGHHDTRRATMVYTRPSIWDDYNKDGKSDFICTNAVTYYARGGELHAVVQMRSNDIWAGYRNDLAWQKHVLEKLTGHCNNYLVYIRDLFPLKPGKIYWQAQNLHIYEKNFYLVDHYIKTGETFISKADYDNKYNN